MRVRIRRRALKDGTVRYDARYRTGGKSRERTFRRKKDAEAFLDKTATSVRDGSYLEVQPAPMSEVLPLRECPVRAVFLVSALGSDSK